MTHDELVAAAAEAQAQAYAPYSRYQVGAALVTDDGRLFTGANVENASYGLSICAERAAVVKAVNAGARRIAAIAVRTASSPPAAPCGMCRQTLAEFSRLGEPLTVISDNGKERLVTTLDELLPRAFRPDALGPGL